MHISRRVVRSAWPRWRWSPRRRIWSARRRRPPAKAAKAAGGFELTVDSIMRGPKLVGYPPTGLRWSGDSSRLYFEWRRPGDDEASTWVVARDGGAAAQAVRRGAPQRAAGQRRAGTAAHRRVLFVDRGDIVLLDSVAGTRRQITRTTGNEAQPALGAPRDRRHLHARQQPLPRAARQRARSSSSPTSQPRKRDPRDTDSQKFVKAEEPKLIEHTRVEAEKKKKAEDEGQGARAAEVRARRSPDGRRISSSRPTARTSSSSSSSARTRRSARTCRTTSPSRATPRTSRRARSSATRRTSARSPS